MRFDIPKCPTCGEPPEGTLESLTGLALLSRPDENSPELEYDGWTEIYWDEQKTVTDEAGKLTLICPNGHDWKSAVTEVPVELEEL